jgi:4-carboxymuconolactone decarboxylase
MPRLDLPARADMTDEQRRVYDEAANGPRGHAPTPFAAWLHSPELAERAQNLGAFVRFGTTVAPRLARIVALIAARHWGTFYIWDSHKQGALALGIDAAIIEDIRQRRRPHFDDARDQSVHDFFVSLRDHQNVPDELYRSCVETLGDKTLVELVAIFGYYNFVAITLKTFQIGAPGAPVEL